MKFSLALEELEALKTLQRNVSGSDYIKVTSILMLHYGNSAQNVSDSLGIDLSTVYRYLGLYQQVGIPTLTGNKYQGYWDMLSSTQISLLRSELKSQVYTNSKSVASWIESSFGVSYTSPEVVDLLNRIGFTYKKTKEIPCECDIEKQQAFVEELSQLFADLDEKSVVYYADGVHPTHNFRSTYAWIEKGQELEQPTVSGRDKVNINAILNANNPINVIAYECQSVNAQSTKELYQAAIEKHTQAEYIYIISDNARSYKNKELNQWLEGTKIEQIFLPPYSPSLNLIERLWKFLRKKVINTAFYRAKEKFRKAIRYCFDNIGNFKQELESLLTLNFRLANSQTIPF